jgi:drug/metabolite transporter (DMT)-like permease
MSVPLAYLSLVLIWSTTPLAIKWSGEEVGFLFGVTARMAIGLLLSLLIVTLWQKRLPLNRHAIKVYLIVALPLYCTMLLIYWASQYVPSGFIAVVFGLTPIFTSLLATVLLQEKSFTFFRVIGMLFGLWGLFIIFSQGFSFSSDTAYGVAGILLGAFLHSLGTVLYKKVDAQLSVFSANTGGLAIAVLLYLITWIATGNKFPLVIPEYTAVSIIYLGSVGSVFGAALFYYALRQVEASNMALLTVITPVTALFIGQLFNNETIDQHTITGTSLVVLGLILHQWAGGWFKTLKSQAVRIGN